MAPYGPTGCLISDSSGNAIPGVSLENTTINVSTGNDVNRDYLVNGDGQGNGSGKYWPGVLGYFDAWFTPTLAAGGDTIYPGWCADIDTNIKLGWWYQNVGCYSSLTVQDCPLIGNPQNLPLVNYLLWLYRNRYNSQLPQLPFMLSATNNEIQAVIWMLLFNGFPWDAGFYQGGGITWDPAIVIEIYEYVTMNWFLLPYESDPTLPIVIIIDCGDQVNLVEIPYWLYLILVDMGIVEDCVAVP